MAGLSSSSSDLRTAMYRLLARIRSEVQAQVHGSGEFADLGSTVAVVVADDERLGAIQIGDGAIVALRRDGSLRQIAAPEQPEFVNQTTFLTSPSWRDSVACHVEEGSDIVGLGLITDGLVPLATLRPKGVPHEPFFEPLFDFAASPEPDEGMLEAFLNSNRVQTATGDDVTVLLVQRGNA